MRVIGVDPGTRLLGWGVVERSGTRQWHVAHGVVAPPLAGAFADRLVFIDDALGEIVAAHGPDVAAVESIFFSKDAQSAAKLGHARGVVLLVAARHGLQVFEYSPLEVKRGIVGYGRAEKSQVQDMVHLLLRLPERPTPDDAADALAVAICHAHRLRLPLSQSKRRSWRRTAVP